MVDSSVRLKLSVELDKSSFKEQVLDLQKELDDYRLKIGVEPVTLDKLAVAESGSDSSQVTPKTFENQEAPGLDFTEFSGTVRAILDYAIALQNVAESIKQEVGEVRKVLISTVQRLGRDDAPSDRQSTFLPRGDSSSNEKPSGLLGWFQNKVSSMFSTSEPAEISAEVLLKISELQKGLDDANLVLEDIADYVKPDDSAINLVNERARIEQIQGTNSNAPNAILPKVSQDPVDLTVGAVAPTATVQLTDIIPNQSSNFDAECCDQITGSIESLTDVVNDILTEVVRVNRDQNRAQNLVTNQNQNISTITNQVSQQTTTNNQAAAPLSPRILDPNSDAGNQKSGNLFDSIAGAFDQIDFSDSLFPIVGVIANLAEPLVNLVGAIAPLGGMLLNAFTTFAPIQARFNTIGGSQEAGQEFFDYVLNFVDKTAQPLMPAIDGYSRLIASAQGTRLEGADTNTLFEGVSKAVTALGLSGEDAQGIFLALSQIISNGKVQAEELRGQIGERLPGTMQLFAESLGMSVAELNKAMEQGELVATTVLPKFGELLNEKFGDAANEASRNFVGSLNRIQTSLTKLQISFAETFGGFANNVAFTISSVLNPILQLFDQLVLKSGLFYNILLGAQAVAVIGITKVLTNFKVGELLLKGIAATYSKIGVVLVPFAYAVAQQLISIGVSKWLGIEIESSVALIVKAYRNLSDSLEPLLTTISQVPGATIKAVSGAFSSLKEAIANTFNSARLVTNRFVEGLKNIVTNLDLVTNRVKATSRELGNFTSLMVNPSPRESQGSNLGEIINIPSLAKVTLELSGLFLLVAQGGLAFVALGKYIKSVVVNFVSMTATTLKAAFSFGVLNKTAGATTATFGALAVALTGIAALLILVAARSKFRFTFENDIGKLESTLAETQEALARLDGSTATINFKAQGLEEIAATTRKSFANLGFNLTFWRDINSGDAFTSDDLIRLFNDRKNINRNQVSGGLISSRMLPIEPERTQPLLDAVTNQLTSTDVPLEEFNKFLDDRTLGGLANLEASLTKKLDDVEAELATTRKLQDPLNSFAEITKLNKKVSELTKEAKSLTTALGKIEESKFATANDNFLLNLDDATTQLAAAPKNLFQQIPIIGSIIPNATTAAFDLGQLQNQIAPSIEVIRETARAQSNPDISSRLISTLQEGSATDLRVLLESIDFSGNRPSINGLQFDGTAQELERFKRAVEFATRGLTSIEKVATNASGNTAKILRETVGIGGGNSEVTEAIAQINRVFFDLEQSGAISNQELKTLTSPGTIGNVEQRLNDFLTQNLDSRVSNAPVASQDEVTQSIEVLREQQKVLKQLGESNNFADILTEEERQLINLQGAVSDFLATVEQSRNTLGTKEFQKANTNIKAFADLIGDTRPVLSANIQKLLELETQLDSLAAERLQVQDRLKSPELSSGERSNLGKRDRELGHYSYRKKQKL
jgi:tape measure domain-containing protein